MRTQWSPLKPKGGANYRTRFLHPTGDDRVTFDPARMSKTIVLSVFAFGAVFLLIGSALTIIWMAGGAGKNGGGSIFRFAGPGFLVGGLFCIAAGVFLKGQLLQVIVFDRQTGRYWQGSDKKASDLHDIHALQILEKRVKQSGPDGGTFTSFELNVVASSGQRQNVIDHCELDALRDEAQTLAEFLRVPLWDTTND